MKQIVKIRKKSILQEKMKGKKILPGLGICIMIALVSKLLGRFLIPIGAASTAIFIGMAVGNTFGNCEKFQAGTKYAESNLLSYSIVLLGGTLSIKTLMKLGCSGVVFILIQMTITIGFAIILGRKLGFSENFSYLMASGNGVCGSSAIAATAPVIGAEGKEKGIAITVVNVTGTVLMIFLPLLASLIYPTDTMKTSALIGGILQSVGQVVASGSLVSKEVKDLATVFKIVRIIFLVFVVVILGTMKRKTNSSKGIVSNAKVKVPWYVMGFFITCALYTAGVITSPISKLFQGISNNFEVIALAGIGMRVNFKELIKQGVKVSLYGLGIGTMQIISAVILIGVLMDKARINP